MVIDMPKVWTKQLMSRIQSIKNAQVRKIELQINVNH